MPSHSSVVNLRECCWTHGTNAKEVSVIKGSRLGNHDTPSKVLEVDSILLIGKEDMPKGSRMAGVSMKRRKWEPYLIRARISSANTMELD